MNEEQTAKLAGLLRAAIKDTKKDVKLLGRRLLELRLLKEKKPEDLLWPKLSIQQQGGMKLTSKQINAAAELVANAAVNQPFTGGIRKPSAAVMAMVEDLSTPVGESKELDAAILMALQAEVKLIGGDLVGAASLVFKSQRLVTTESSRLTILALSKKIEALNDAQDAKQAPHRAVKKWVQDRWEAEGDGRKSPPVASSNYYAILEKKRMLNHETGNPYSAETILVWLRVC